MNLKGIKNQSDEIYIKYKKQIIPEFFYVGYLGLLAQYIQKAFFSLFVSLFLCSISHGYVKSAMTLVDEENPKLTYKQSMVGILEFPRVAPIYIMKKVMTLLITFIVSIPMLNCIGKTLSLLSFDGLSSLGNAFIQTEFFIPYFNQYLKIFQDPLVFINCLVLFVVYLYLTALFLPVPYIMEQEEFSWLESFQYSFSLMKGHFLHFFKLYLFYFLRHVFYWGVTGVALMLLGDVNECLKLFCFVFSLFLYIDVFKGRFEIAKYLFYKEIRGDDDEANQ